MREALRRELGLFELRDRFRGYTRRALEALHRLPGPPPRRVLELGAGRGSVTLTLAAALPPDTGILGIDIDGDALAEAERALREAGLAPRVSVRHVGLMELDPGPTPGPDPAPESGPFDLIWEEGVLHLLEDDQSLPRCHALLRPGGLLVCAECVAWLEARQDVLARAGFTCVARLPWTPGCWWTEYYAPLSERVKRVRAGARSTQDAAALAQLEAEIAAARADVPATDCAHHLYRRNG